MTALDPTSPPPALAEQVGRQRGLLLVAVAAVIWSTGGLIVRSLDDPDIWTTVFWRSLFAVLFLLGFIVVRDRRRALSAFLSMGWPGLLVAVCFAAASTCLVVALTLTSVANTLIIFSTSPFFAALFGWLLLHERVRLPTWLAMGTASIGIAIMVSDSAGRGALAGDLVASVTAIGLALATVTIRANKSVRMTPATCLGALLAGLVALPLATPLAVTGHDFGLLFAFGALQLGLGLALFTTGARFAPAADVALVCLLEPILGPLWVWGLLGEHPGDAGLVGGGLVLTALLVHSALDLRKRRAAPPAV